MSGPYENGTPARDALGRFGRGNRAACGHGNPWADRALAWRGALVEAVSPDDLRAVVRRLVRAAKAGEPWAIRELLDRTLGRAVQPAALTVSLDDMSAQEQRLAVERIAANPEGRRLLRELSTIVVQVNGAPVGDDLAPRVARLPSDNG